MGAVITYVLSRKLETWRLRLEYRVRNVEKTYAPLLAELTKILETVEGYLELIQSPNHYAIIPDWKSLDKIKKEGLFELMLASDKRLAEKVDSFFRDVHPKMLQLDEKLRSFDDQLLRNWEDILNPLQLPQGTPRGVALELRDRLRFGIIKQNKDMFNTSWTHQTFGARYGIDSVQESLWDAGKQLREHLIEEHGKVKKLVATEKLGDLQNALRKRIAQPV
jgi:hypothetical protein